MRNLFIVLVFFYRNARVSNLHETNPVAVGSMFFVPRFQLKHSISRFRHSYSLSFFFRQRELDFQSDSNAQSFLIQLGCAGISWNSLGALFHHASSATKKERKKSGEGELLAAREP